MADMAYIDRRTLIIRAGGLASMAALPLGTWHSYLAASPPLADATRKRLLAVVADTMIPRTDTLGAFDARVTERILGLLANWASARTRAGIDGALSRIDRHARVQFGKGIAALGKVERTSSLTEFDLLALKEASDGGGPAKVEHRKAEVVDPEYLQLKQLILRLYYYSKEAAESELKYEHVPGQWQPSITVSSGFRPWLGSGRN